jgi:Xaa-Pro aminopeptidase
MDHAGRIEAVRSLLDEKTIDGLLVTNLTNVRYLTGFSGTNGQVLVTKSTAVFLVDPRYDARARTLVDAAEIVIYPNRLTEVLPAQLAAAQVSKLGVEAGTVTLASRDDLDARLEGIELIPVKDLVEGLRRRKEPAEIALIKEAVSISDRTLAWALDRIAPGVAERELAMDLEVHMRQAGAEAVSFDPIVGSGPLSAHIHHTASDRTFEKGDLVLLDFGCRFEGYCSDLTRTLVVGPANDEQLAIYSLVLEAQKSAIAAISSGAVGSECDAVARAVIDKARHGDHFGHGLGHGVGLDIHEQPTLNRLSEDVLEPGHVVTVEPGVYVPGVGGVRIEDCVVVTEDGCEVLGSAPKDTLTEL